MRDYVFFPLIVVLCLIALPHPWVGVLTWTWLSVMNAHQYTWAVASFPVAAMVAGSTLLGVVITKDPRRFSVTPESALLMLFMFWVTLTLPFSFSVEQSLTMYSTVMKIDLMVLVTLVLLHSRRQIELFVWIVVISLGFFGVKGGIFTILSGGQQRVWGPGGFIGGNNEIALALIIVIPLMRYLQLQAQEMWKKLIWSGVMLLTAIAALGSQSRGALVAIAGMGLVLWIKSPRKIVTGVGIALGSALAVGLMSTNWEARMSTILDYEKDSSAQGRINAWWMAWNLAKDNFFGGGFDIYTAQVFAQYAPNPTDVHAAHSIYFQVLGEQGFVGLAIYLLMWLFVWRSANALIREAGKSEETRWCRNLASMCQVSLVGFAVGGAFLSLAYFDLPYDVLAMIVLTRRWIRDRMTAAAPAAQPVRADKEARVGQVGQISRPPMPTQR